MATAFSSIASLFSKPKPCTVTIVRVEQSSCAVPELKVLEHRAVQLLAEAEEMARAFHSADDWADFVNEVDATLNVPMCALRDRLHGTAAFDALDDAAWELCGLVSRGDTLAPIDPRDEDDRDVAACALDEVVHFLAAARAGLEGAAR